MSIETLVSEALMENCRVTGRGLCSLLAFWRAYRKSVPSVAKIDSATPIVTYSAWGQNKKDQTQQRKRQNEMLERRRHIWDRISDILDMPDERALNALGDIVNSDNVSLDDLRPFIFSFSQADERRKDPVYQAYHRSVYVPFQYLTY